MGNIVTAWNKPRCTKQTMWQLVWEVSSVSWWKGSHLLWCHQLAQGCVSWEWSRSVALTEAMPGGLMQPKAGRMNGMWVSPEPAALQMAKAASVLLPRHLRCVCRSTGTLVTAGDRVLEELLHFALWNPLVPQLCSTLSNCASTHLNPLCLMVVQALWSEGCLRDVQRNVWVALSWASRLRSGASTSS